MTSARTATTTTDALRAIAAPLLLGLTLALAGCGNDSPEAPKAAAPVADGISIDIGGGVSPLPIGFTPNPSDIDTSWGTGGRLTLTDRTINLTALDAQNRLLLTGRTATGFYVQRLLANGRPDPAFGTAGVVTLGLGDAAKSDYPISLIPLESGLLVAVEQDVVASASTGIDTLLRLDGAGAVVPYATGVDHLSFSNAVAVTRDSRGRLYVLSSSVNVTDAASLDPYIDLSAAGAFTGPTHFTTTFLGQEIGYIGNRLFRLPGTITANPWTLSRYLSDGSLDAGFAGGGVYTGTADPAEAMILAGGDLPRVHYSHCSSSTLCEGAQALFADNGSMTPSPMNTFTPGRVFDMAAILPADLPSGPGEVVTVSGDVWTAVSNADGSSVLNKVPMATPYRVATYPDGFVDLFTYDRLTLRKFTASGATDTGWNAGAAERSGYSDASGAVLALSVDGGGGVFISGNASEYSLTYMTPTTPAEIVRVKGSAPDTLPDTPASVADATLAAGAWTLQAPIVISGLGNNVAVPVRLSLGEISVDTGGSWHRGWVWARNNTSLLVRYPIVDPDHPGEPATTLLTVGGVLAPANPALPVGPVLTVRFSEGKATVVSTATPAASGGSGGAADGALGVMLALLMLRRRRR